MLSRVLRTTALVGVATALSLGSAVPVANAQATDAVNGCGASVISDDYAYVPPEVRLKRFLHVYAGAKRIDFKCGDGHEWGAVHVELKHDVPDWAEAATCIVKTVTKGSAVHKEKNKTQYTYTFSSVTVRVVLGSVNGLVTAYPLGTGVAKKWRQCAAS